MFPINLFSFTRIKILSVFVSRCYEINISVHSSLSLSIMEHKTINLVTNYIGGTSGMLIYTGICRSVSPSSKI